MKKTAELTKRAAVEFSLQWQSRYARHNDRWYAEKIDFWRDFFPGKLQKNIAALSAGESWREDFASGCLVPEYSEKKVIEFARKLYHGAPQEMDALPEPGRFYPLSSAWKPLHSFPNTTAPFRLIAASGDTLTADINHPLAQFPLSITATMIESQDTATQRGGAANDIAEMLTMGGPGMQGPDVRCPINPYKLYPLTKSSDEEDKAFYRSPRLVHHLDGRARGHVQAIYDRLLQPGTKILDLMSSWESHLPDSLKDCELTGMGLNEEELASNAQLAHSLVQDLNTLPTLPFADSHFAAVICTVSIEYLVRPREVIAEIARILRPGGIFVVILSDRWFPGQEIRPWADLHPFERQGLVLQYFLHEKGFEQVSTESLRGYPRPVGDRYSDQLYWSDPLFVVSATRRS